MGIKIPLGIESFAEMQEGGYYYIDKTLFIKELLDTNFKVNLITRPRRFGKTLTMSMLEDFFDIRLDSAAHFEGLDIAENAELCRKWNNQWPVVFLSLKNVEGLGFDSAYGMLRVLIADMCKRYAFLEKSDVVDRDDRAAFEKIKSQKAADETLKSSLLLLTRMMAAHYGKPVILLVDEYDVPLARAHDEGYYPEMLEVIRTLLGTALKTNPYLKFGVVTGCLKISKESIFTGINNLVANTITAERFDEYIGFTEPEVQKLLSVAGFEDHAEKVRLWYDGYRFGGADVYCPWDVLNHVAALMANPQKEPESYWASTSHNQVIYKLFENRDFDVNGKFQTLLSGGAIREAITEELTYDTLEASEENLWSLLFMTGYLTLERNEEIAELPSGTEKLVSLRIPNEEVKYIFQRSVVSWFQKTVQTLDRTEIFQALWTGDVQTAEERISDLLFDSITYHDYLESYYHAFMAGLFAGAGYAVESNHIYGNGRPDIVIKERRNRRVLLFEVKHTKKGETLEHACTAAVKQIAERRYAEGFRSDGYRTVISYGIAFKESECRILKAE